MIPDVNLSPQDRLFEQFLEELRDDPEELQNAFDACFEFWMAIGQLTTAAIQAQRYHELPTLRLVDDYLFAKVQRMIEFGGVEI